MSPARLRFLDTNVLLYSISTAADEARKRDIAAELLDVDDLALSVQVLQEFYVQATRRTRENPLDPALAERLMRSWLRFKVQEMNLAVMFDALAIQARYQLSYWDAAIVSAARLLGCREVLTEDMRHGQDLGGVVVVNPFRGV